MVNHKTLNVFIAVLLLAIAATVTFFHSAAAKRHFPHPSPTPTPPPTIILAWNPVAATTDPDTKPIGYHLHAGFSAGGENQVIDVGNVTQYTYTGTAGTLYYFTVTAYNQALTDSLPSNEISAVAP